MSDGRSRPLQFPGRVRTLRGRVSPIPTRLYPWSSPGLATNSLQCKKGIACPLKQSLPTRQPTGLHHLPRWTAATPDPQGSRAPTPIALGKLLAETNLTTFDGGFVNTASTKSAITYIDGDAGILRYRGIPIDQLAEKSTFIEVSYLLIYGELPTRPSSRTSPPRSSGTPCCTRTSSASSTVSRARNAIRCRWALMVRSSRSAPYYRFSTRNDPEQVELSTIRLLAKMPTIAAYGYKVPSASRSCTRTTR